MYIDFNDITVSLNECKQTLSKLIATINSEILNRTEILTSNSDDIRDNIESNIKTIQQRSDEVDQMLSLIKTNPSFETYYIADQKIKSIKLENNKCWFCSIKNTNILRK